MPSSERIVLILVGLVMTAAGVVLTFRGLPDEIGAFDSESVSGNVLWICFGIALAIGGILMMLGIPAKDVVAFMKKNS